MIEDIIKAIEKNLGITLVLHKSMKTHSVLKAYKIFSYNLYAIEDNKTLLLSLVINKNLATETIAEAKEDSDKQFIHHLVEWLTSDDYRKLKNDRSK